MARTRAGRTYERLESKFLRRDPAYRPAVRRYQEAHRTASAVEQDPESGREEVGRAREAAAREFELLRALAAHVLKKQRSEGSGRDEELTRMANDMEAAVERFRKANRRTEEADRKLRALESARTAAQTTLAATARDQETALRALTDPADRLRARQMMEASPPDDRPALQESVLASTPQGTAGPPRQRNHTPAPVGRPEERICPVCKKGLPPDRDRHQRCENRVAHPDAAPSSVRVATPVAVTPSPAATGDPKSSYRALVERVDSREAVTFGERRQGADRPVRLPESRRAVLLRCGGRCENPTCSGQPVDVTDAGDALLEVDHVEEIATGGRDHPRTMVALCPNCHAVKTRGRGREALRTVLAGVAERAHQNWMLG
ncbi:HNH endonuclease [Kitasatospora sp. NPDC089913]|uniref:HNH endonuclease n=1 Tax=Kitasatospora sp. NPDC089913 TaxID=3364080 RepID=UPI00380F7C54